MTKRRIVWEPCPDCGRTSAAPGGCFVVERRGLFGWRPALVAYDRGGRECAEHYHSVAEAKAALAAALAPEPVRAVIEYLD